jgi:hypothetical protein
MTQLFTNNAASTLASSVSDITTSLVLATGEGAKFPAITGSDYFLLVLYEVVDSREINHEIVKVTARSSDTLTVVRGQEGTTARAWGIGTAIELRDTAATLAGMLQATVTSPQNNQAIVYDSASGNWINSSTIKTTIDSPQATITANSSGNAVTITQTGTGNALVVEDSASPDSTPVVVDANGSFISGHTAALAFTRAQTSSGTATVVPRIGIISSTTAAQFGTFYYNSTVAAAKTGITIARSRGVDPNTKGVLVSSDTIGGIDFIGDDGSNFLSASTIFSSVDGTPGTNAMPGRLSLLTTRGGQFTISSIARVSNVVTVTASSTVAGLIAVNDSVVIAGVTDTGFNGTFTITAIPTSTTFTFAQTAADASSSGGTATVGITTPTERLRIDSAGRVGLNSTPLITSGVRYQTPVTGAATCYGFYVQPTIRPDVSTEARLYFSYPSVDAGANLGFLSHFYVQNNVFTGTVVNQYGFLVSSLTTGATNNYGFFGNIPSGTGRWNFYAAGTASNYFGGDTTISVNTTADALRITQAGTGNALVVEDSANPDSTPFIITATGQVVQGHTSVDSAWYSPSTTPDFFSIANTAGTKGFASINYNGSAGFTLYRANGGVIGTEQSVVNGDILGVISFGGHDGGSPSFKNCAYIFATVDGTTGTNAIPTRLAFSTTRGGRFTISSISRASNVVTVTASSTVAGLIAVNDSVVIADVTDSGFNGTFTITAIPTSTTFTFAQTASDASSSGGTATVGITTPTEAIRITSSRGIGIGGTPSAGERCTVFNGQVTGLSNQYGFVAHSGLTGATNNYGFISNIPASTGRWSFYAVSGSAASYFACDMQFDKTVTAAGTTGAQTINKNAGSVNFAAAATSLVVTDSRVTTSSIIIATVATNDSTMKSVAAVAGSGSFTLHANAAATAETRVNFLIIN